MIEDCNEIHPHGEKGNKAVTYAKIKNALPPGPPNSVFWRRPQKGYEFASGLRAGRICFNGAPTNSVSPMGGYKESGIGRSMGEVGPEEYLEMKSVYGFEEEASELLEFGR